MSIMQASFVAIVLLLILGCGVHLLNVRRIHGRIERLESKAVPMEKLLPDLYSCQGSNFNSLILAAWILFLAGAAFLYLLTPAVFPDGNYFAFLPGLSSSWVGLVIFGLLGYLIMILVIVGGEKLPESCRCFRLAELYGYYTLSRNEKRVMIAAIPLLWISILISTHMATVYPELWAAEWWTAFLLLLASLVLLIWPVAKEMFEGR
ncbi:MAG: hypothetical protein JW986_08695 [Methanotrichaceae archaeon]|nr:hypothetical protein [Methanotrichaceae archaeon]